MFKTMIKITNVWVAATNSVPRAQARRIANAYRSGMMSTNVQDAKVVRAK